ncbi:MAG: sigma-70 family RNA polymerase sigma factor [Patescibacteria group bacterium]
MSDEQLLKISYSRPSRFGELFDRHNKRFIRIARRALRSEDDVEDVVQETFVRIYKYGKKFPENGGKFSSWSNTILKNCLADQINKYKNIPISFTDEMEAITPSLSQEEILNNGNKNYIQFVLDKIGGATAEILNLRFVLGKSFKEIAKILNIKSGAARVRVHRSKKIFIQTYKQFNNNYDY